MLPQLNLRSYAKTMRAGTLISVSEYLSTSYRPDCDYVDGEVLERNLGELDHCKLLRKLILYFGVRKKQWRIHVFPEQRVQVSKTRFRVPDVCVVAGADPPSRSSPSHWRRRRRRKRPCRFLVGRAVDHLGATH